jgi:Peptidase family C25
VKVDKIVVSCADALIDKYGAEGLAKIREALDAMVEADAKRHINTRVVFADRHRDMGAYGHRIDGAATPKTMKAAVDAIYAIDKPDYIMLLGAWDVVPVQSLDNPLYDAKDEDPDDRRVESDLPYACDAPFSRDINDFIGPTRVVGRLPDLMGATDPAYLLRIMRTAMRARTRDASDYDTCFALSAQLWKASTALSLRAIYQHSSKLLTCPLEGPDWPARNLSPRVHFINCHGGQNETTYYGEAAKHKRSYQLPPAHQAPWLRKKITEGAVMAAECCYGAQLYDPQDTENQAGIAYTYLDEGAYGVFGSSTIAYGPYSGNDSADLIAQMFLGNVLHGASLGRATLEAWQSFAGKWSHLNPEHQKTIAQFYLLGDPSIHAVRMAARSFDKTKVFKDAFRKTHDAGPRKLRREKLLRAGRSIEREMPRTVRNPKLRASKSVDEILRRSARESGMGRCSQRHYAVEPKRLAPLLERVHRTVHVFMRVRRRKKGAPDVTLITATAENGKLIHIRRSHSR